MQRNFVYKIVLQNVVDAVFISYLFKYVFNNFERSY